MNFKDLGDLMYGFQRTSFYEDSQFDQRPYTPGQIATAIEKYGVYGVGRFAESGNYTSDQIKADALKAVEATQLAYVNTDFGDTSAEFHIDLFFENEESIRRYGWPEACLPTFEKPSTAEQLASKKRGPKVNTQTILLKGLIQLAIDNPDNKWSATLDDLFVAAGFPDMNKENKKNEKNEVSRLYEALGAHGNRDTLVNFLRQLGRLGPDKGGSL